MQSDAMLLSSALPQQPQPSSINNIDDKTESEGQSSVGAGIGGGVGAAVVLLVVAVLVAGLVIVWRRRTKSKVELQHSSGVLGMANPVYSGRWGCTI